jgi:hypothetical protein
MEKKAVKIKSVKSKENRVESKLPTDITIGADPELFLKDKDGKIVPAFLLVKGTKEEPEPISEKGHSIQYDNVMIEYQIPPCKTEDEFVENNKFVLKYIEETICNPKGLKISITASEHIENEYLEHPIANEFGCSPDFNAHTGDENKVVKGVPTLRSAGAHLHCSYTGLTPELAIKLIKALDLLISVPLVLIEPDSERKKLYGKAGAFRLKQLKSGNYIVEYRSPSNFWLSSEDTMRFVYQQMIKAVEYVSLGGDVTNPDDIVNAINNNDKELAKEIISDYNMDIPNSLLPISKNVELNYENDSLGG